jgi:hypothetical protein
MKTRAQLLAERAAGNTSNNNNEEKLGFTAWLSDKTARSVQNTELDLQRAKEQRLKEGYKW